MNEELFAPVRYLIAEIMEVAPEAVTPQSGNTTLEKWDSLRHLKLVAALDDTFEIEIDDDEIEDCLEVAGIVALLERKLSRPAA